jgi:hypothetical protein
MMLTGSEQAINRADWKKIVGAAHRQFFSNP